MLNKICTWTAKTAPYSPCTVTAYRLKYQDSARMLRRVTLTKLYRRAVRCHFTRICTLLNIPMRTFLRMSLVILIFHCSMAVYSQTAIQKSAENYTCNCIDFQIKTDSVNTKEKAIVDCFYNGVSRAIEEKYTVDGKLKMTGKRFIIVSGDLLHYLQENLYNTCLPYKKYILTSKKSLLRFK